MLIGMAKPWFPWFWPFDWKENPAEAAVSTPMTWPEVLTSAPPESPAWMFAFVSIRPLSCSLVPSPWSLSGDRLVECRDRPAGRAGCAAGPAGVADADDVLAHRDAGRVGEVGRLETRGVVELEHGDVAGAVVADDARGVGLLVADVGDADARRAVDDVVVGEDLAIGRHHDAGARRLLLLVAERRVDVDQARVDFVGNGVDVTRAGRARRGRSGVPAAGVVRVPGHDPEGI